MQQVVRKEEIVVGVRVFMFYMNANIKFKDEKLKIKEFFYKCLVFLLEC